MISIIVPVYNAEKYIKKTIDSVKAQTYSDWELILVDDGSTDNSAQEILASNDERIRYVRNESGKKGAAGARNYGISIALGRYIAFIDADDIWQKDKLQKTLDYMERNEYEFVFTAYDFGDENAESVGKTVHVPKDLTYKKALSRTVIFTSTVMFDLNKLEKDMIYMPYIASEDTATWWNVLRSGVVAHGLDESLVIYRRSSGTLSANKFVAIKRIWGLYRKNEKFGILKSMLYMIGWAWRAVARRM